MTMTSVPSEVVDELYRINEIINFLSDAVGAAAAENADDRGEWLLDPAAMTGLFHILLHVAVKTEKIVALVNAAKRESQDG